LPRLRKTPVQARAKFTVQAIYDAYVRIWRRDGLAAVTTRAVAEESGFAIGTLYDYFPNKAALHAGYVRHVMDALRDRIRTRVTEQGQGPWRARLRLLVEITCAADEDAPFFDTDMHYIEPEIAAPRHHQRSFDALAEAWLEAIAGWTDLDPQPAPETIRTLVFAVWGAMRYRLLADPLAGGGDWQVEMLRICERSLAPRS
jgi:AcrR family transcriptional regulator